MCTHAQKNVQKNEKIKIAPLPSFIFHALSQDKKIFQNPLIPLPYLSSTGTCLIHSSFSIWVFHGTQ